MRGWIIVAAALALPGCADPLVGLFNRPPTFDRADLARLRFLEGRWTGQGPDGRPFFEAYSFRDPLTLRSRRYKDASFSEEIDGSLVALEGEQIVSRWGRYSWKAADVGRGRAQFVPIDAPSSFTWQRVDRNRVLVTQQWTDDKGPQSYTVHLQRIR